uniref:Ras guanyl-releasing protein 3 n=1 Tax=Ditylenchus dipsaci TaxID=166011 RepID=A0A915D9J6_9BILA
MNFPSCSSADESDLNVFALIRRCSDSFDEHGEPTSELPQCLFMIGEYLLENTELMAQFVSLYQEEPDEYGVKICSAVSFWIRHFPMHFDANHQLCALVDRLKKMMLQEGKIEQNLVNDLDLSSVPSYAWLRNVSVRNPVSRHVSLSFDQWSPEDLSNAMSHIDYRVLSRVTIPEIKRYVRANKLSQTPILERSIAVFNSLSCWVQCMILSKNGARERADIITKFINVGKNLRKQCNFNTLMAVIGGVSHSNISRLTKTHALLEEDVKKDLANLTQLLSNSNNYASYRKTIQEVRNRFKIPIMGIHLKDLIAWHIVSSEFDKTRNISEKKLFQLANLLSYFLGVNRQMHNFADPNMDLINTLKVSFDISYNENDIYDLSLKREPRTLLNFQSGVQKPIVFADWASGVLPAPDPDTINKHITAMVEAVFKHYDNDKDAYISSTIDMDRDGQISKSEMKAYFINLNKQSTEFRRGFKHSFSEATFLTPAVCAHCKKLLWGIIRQGFKCKDCGLIVHEACKDVAVVECRLKNAASNISVGFSDWILNSPRNNGSRLGSSATVAAANCSAKKSAGAVRNKNRTISTVSESPSPSPELPHPLPSDVSNSSTAFMSATNSLRSSFHRFIRPSKNRATSETTECVRPKKLEATSGSGCNAGNCIASSSSNPAVEHQASLASEEVFEEENNASGLLSPTPLTSVKKCEASENGHRRLAATTPITSRFYLPSPAMSPTKKKIVAAKKKANPSTESPSLDDNLNSNAAAASNRNSEDIQLQIINMMPSGKQGQRQRPLNVPYQASRPVRPKRDRMQELRQCWAKPASKVICLAVTVLIIVAILFLVYFVFWNRGNNPYDYDNSYQRRQGSQQRNNGYSNSNSYHNNPSINSQNNPNLQSLLNQPRSGDLSENRQNQGNNLNSQYQQQQQHFPGSSYQQLNNNQQQQPQPYGNPT